LHSTHSRGKARLIIVVLQLSSLLHLIPLPLDHPLVQIFQIKTLNELHNPSDHEISLCDRLLGPDFFPNSLWLMSMRACALYHLHGKIARPCIYVAILHDVAADYGQAERQFERILALDPNHIDDIDIYSNILYVQDNKLKLSKLAHEFLALDKDRPEICCLIGQSYAMLLLHSRCSRLCCFQGITTLYGQSMRKPSNILGERLNLTVPTSLPGH